MTTKLNWTRDGNTWVATGTGGTYVVDGEDGHYRTQIRYSTGRHRILSERTRRTVTMAQQLAQTHQGGYRDA